MRKVILSVVLLLGILSVLARTPHRYCIEDAEVSEEFYNGIRDSIRNNCMVVTFDYDTLIVTTLYLPYTHYLDSISEPGKVVIKEHNPERISLLKSLITEQSQKTLKFHAGDSISFKISLQDIRDNIIEKDFCDSEKCYYISYWATWCGNCLIELQEENIPYWISQFKDHKDFQFIPICIDSSPSELHQFFESEYGNKWAYLSDITLIDNERESNSLFAEGGNLPLNVVIGKGGIIRYIKIGRIEEAEQINELQNAINLGLAPIQ